MKRLLSGLLASALGLMFVLLLLEGGLRLFPVNEGLRTLQVNDSEPVLRFTKNRTATWSRGPFFSIVNTVRVNNDGFVNAQDYDPSASGPLVAVVGDSYVEAAMVPYQQTFYGLLAAALAPRARIYSFGASGAPLSQYLIYAQYARDTYSPERLIISVVGNDFDESLLTPASRPGFHYFAERDGSTKLVRLDYAPSPLVRLARRSQLVRYLVLNLEVSVLYQRLFAKSEAASPRYVGQTRSDASEKRLAGSRRAVDEFLARLPGMSGLEPDRILLVVDGIRPSLYDPASLAEAKESYFGQMRTYLMEGARGAGFAVLDMQPVFETEYAADQTRFEFPDDAHWNALGHEAVARAVAGSGFLGVYVVSPESLR